MLNFARKKERLLIPIALAVLATLFVASPTIASGNKTINIVGTNVWAGPNTFILNTYRFDSGPIFVKSGTIIMINDNTPDPHTLTLVVPADLPSTPLAAVDCTTGICAAAGAGVPPSAPPPFCFSTESPAATGTTASSPCVLETPFSVETATTGDQVAIVPGQPIYIEVVGTPGTVIHFMCVFHPWMQGEFIITK